MAELALAWSADYAGLLVCDRTRRSYEAPPEPQPPRLAIVTGGDSDATKGADQRLTLQR